jgi:hypothetical protein
MHGSMPPLPHMSSWHGVSLGAGYVLMAWYLIKHRDSFTFTIFYIFSQISCIVDVTVCPLITSVSVYD